MGQIAAPLAFASQAMGIINNVKGMRHNNKMAELQYQQQHQESERQKRELKEKKKRDMASLRAKYGAKGQASSGSAQAILRGLSQNYANTASDMAKNDALRHRRNLLESRKRRDENIHNTLTQAGKLGKLAGPLF